MKSKGKRQFNPLPFPLKVWMLSSLILVASVLRLIQIGAASLWFDEAISFLAAQLRPSQLLNDAIRDPHPPLYYLLLHGWFRLLPNTDVSGRLLSVVFNLLQLPAGYVLGHELLGEAKPALFVAMLLAISPFHILYSHELRMYTLLMLLATLVAYAYLRARRTGRPRWWFLFAGLSLAAVYTHLFAAFLLVAIGLHALIGYRQRDALRNTVVVGLLLALAFLPWLFVLAGESQQAVGSLRPLLGSHQDVAPNTVKPLITLAFLIFGESDTLWYSAGALFLTLALLAIFPLDLLKARRQTKNGNRLLLPLLVLLCTVGIPVTIYFIRPFFLPERTMAVASPFLFILLAWGVKQHRSPLPYLVYATVVLMGIGTTLYLLEGSGKPPYRQAINFIAANRQPGDVVAHTSDGSYLPALSYVSFPQHVLLAGDPDMRKPASAYRALGAEIWTQEEIANGRRRLWLVVALEHSLEWQKEQQEAFTRRFPLFEAYEIGGIQIYLYDLTG